MLRTRFSIILIHIQQDDYIQPLFNIISGSMAMLLTVGIMNLYNWNWLKEMQFNKEL